MSQPRTTIAVRRGVSHDYVSVLQQPGDAVPIFNASAAPTMVREALRSSGCVVARGCATESACERLVRAFREEVKPSDASFPRHQGGAATPHVIDEFGHMKWGMTNVHLLPTDRFGGFVSAVCDLVTGAALVSLMQGLFEEPPKIVNTMFFEGNQYTHGHQDSWYKDSHRQGELVAAWIALEDIAEEAGRFFVCPGSHAVDFWPVRAGLLATPTDVQRFFDQHEIRCAAPALQKGDAILWTSLTLHGSLETTDGARSRNSITAHYLPSSDGLLYLRHPVLPSYATVAGVPMLQDHDEELMAQLPLRR